MIGMAPKGIALASLLEEHSPLDNLLRVGAVIVIIGYIILESTVFQKHYSKRLVNLYSHPWWRMLLIGFVALGTWWCPRVGLVLAIAVYFYLNDMQILSSSKFAEKPLAKDKAILESH